MVRCTWDTCFLTPTPTPLRATSACGASTCFIRWDGTTTAYPPSDACRTISVSPVTRRCLIRPVLCRRFVVTHPKTTVQYLCRGRTSSSCATNSPLRTSKCSKICSAASGCRWIGRCCTRPSLSMRGARRSARFSTTCRGARPTPKKHQLCGTSTLAPQWHRPSWKIANARGLITRWHFTEPRVMWLLKRRDLS